MRIGHGFDVHRLVAGRKLILGGVEIPCELGLLGHSDADVLCHAVSDALLGALALGDIGKHFPDSDPRWKDADSLMLLGRVAGLARERGYAVVNVDATLILQRPKVAPYVERMRANIAHALGVAVEAVSVKATTSEGMGYEGRGEGASCHAVVLVERIGEEKDATHSL
ncbi:MAG TPA: 2-C-methyl-D-erythritol 2,4-cyclodiphosphate synthase [bacterium]|nr:2-C-methyl-D-erythritol 2,4-cyclodiphosphate synthase [bacterium]HQG46106.1 2-C-methyl-D-erythritol 2,4-cyclodiphosphate synthase [bacterium]HQI48847.1 2-C-methyl-D-erythritol 2,4-cyclodiphosphate synthase [bacterium]HQJ66026.1 2-C-methyl-D-erythritol 2,4-cyclodiphosphate synthase [bacterium]